MIAYKFRSQDQLKFILDIILKNRLYCADWKTMSDKTEGKYMFQVFDGYSEEQIEAIKEKISEKKGKIKICCLSKEWNAIKLWDFYAGGYGGVAIEVELPDIEENLSEFDKNERIYEIRDIDYNREEKVSMVHNIGEWKEELNIEDVVKNIFFSKLKSYKDEEEKRILFPREYYPIKPIKRIYVGSEMQDQFLDILKEICDMKGIQLIKVEMSWNGLKATPI